LTRALPPPPPEIDCSDEDKDIGAECSEEEKDNDDSAEEELDDDGAVEMCPAEHGDEDVDIEISDEAAPPEPADPEVNFTALQARMRAEVEEAAAKKIQEAQAATTMSQAAPIPPFTRTLNLERIGGISRLGHAEIV
jgi:hypothetical protein